MQLQIKSSNNQAYSHALLELNTFSLKNVLRRWCNKLLNSHFNYEEFQDNSENDNKNETAEAV